MSRQQTTVQLIAIGDEILIGQIKDTNTSWIAKQLAALSIDVVSIRIISDNEQQIHDTLQESIQRYDLTIVTGGLGPTKDDKTKPILCRIFDTQLVHNHRAYELIEQRLKYRQKAMNELNQKQALLPESCTVMENYKGTAMGMLFQKDKHYLISLPGVPAEMEHLFESQVIPFIQSTFSPDIFLHQTLLLFGVSESVISMQLESFENDLQPYIKLAYLPNYAQLRLRLSIRHQDATVAKDVLNSHIAKLKTIVGQYVVADREVNASYVIDYLKANGKRIAFAESCTGGNLCGELVQISGASDVVRGAIVTYQTDTKTQELNISKEFIDTHGVVSEQVSQAMSNSVRSRFETDYAIGITGAVGPHTDEFNTEVGKVIITVASAQKHQSTTIQLIQNRTRNIAYAVNYALVCLMNFIHNEKKADK